MVKYIPSRGDVVWLQLDPQQGKEIQKTRSAVVVSPLAYNQKTGLALFLPITSQIKGYPFEVVIKHGELEGAILCDQVRSLDWQVRRAKFHSTLPSDVFEEALAKILVLIAV